MSVFANFGLFLEGIKSRQNSWMNCFFFLLQLRPSFKTSTYKFSREKKKFRKKVFSNFSKNFKKILNFFNFFLGDILKFWTHPDSFKMPHGPDKPRFKILPLVSKKS